MRKDRARGRRTVAILVDDVLSPMEFGIAAAVFGTDRSSEIGRPWYHLIVCGAHAGPIRTDGPFSITPDTGIDGLDEADTIVVPPFGDDYVLGAEVAASLVRAHERGARLMSLCTGAFVLATAGLLDDRPATTHWTSADLLRRQHHSVRVDRNVLYVDDGDILTSAGSAASMDLCLHVVRLDYGAEVANLVARDLVVPPHRDGGQAQYVQEPMVEVSSLDPFGETLAWTQEHLDEPLSVASLARRAAMSQRSFARRFTASTGTSPHRWICRQRVLMAQRLLETTDLTIDDVAMHCGLGTAANLRLHFANVLRASPSTYRRTFKATIA
jgi:AraC family transcriptional regulator, transcriptional activator FtrA